MTHDYSAKGMFWFLLNCVLVLAMVLGLVGIGTLIRYSNAVVPSRIITVSGEGKTAIKPDIATYSFSVVSQGTDPEKVQKGNTEKMNKAISFVKEMGIKDADIKTTGYNLYPRYSYDKETGRSLNDGYELTQTVTIKIRDLETVGKVLSGLVRVGVNQAGSLQYSVENPEAQRAKARQEAFDNAYIKASQMAYQNGVRIARVINFSENNYGGPIYYGKAMSAMVEGRGGDMAPMTEPGTEEIVVNVSVTYEIR
jgi:uncharacterized protein YggE